MNISLRRANALQNSINDAIKAIDLSGTVTLTEFHAPIMEIDQAATKFKTNLARRDALVEALYSIRHHVSAANSQAGVDSLLTHIAHREKTIQNYTELSERAVGEKEAVVVGKLEKIKSRPADSRNLYGYDTTVSTTVFSQQDIDGFKAEVTQAKKAKQRLQDQLLELNVRTEVTLSAATVQTLTAENLL